MQTQGMRWMIAARGSVCLQTLGTRWTLLLPNPTAAGFVWGVGGRSESGTVLWRLMLRPAMGSDGVALGLT